MAFKGGRWLWRLTMLICLWGSLTKDARGQEALRLSLAGEAAAKSRSQAAATIGNYNLLVGSTAWRFSAGLRAEYNDNVRLQSEAPEGDFIFRPNINVQMHRPVTDKNSLDISLAAGYSEYLQHTELNQFFINPGSGISFDIFIGDFAINLHDQISVTENTYENPGVNGNGANNAQLQNSAGVSATWDLNKAVVTAGYDHANYMSLSSSQQSQPDGSSDNLHLNAGVRVRPEILVGVEAGGGLTSYDQSGSNVVSPDTLQWNAGVFCQAQISEYMSARLDVGYTVLSPQSTASTNLTVADIADYYFQFSLSHRVNRFLDYTLSAGRSTDFGFYGQAHSHYFARLQPNWNLFRKYQISTPFAWEQGSQTYNQAADYEQFSMGINIGRPITKKLSASISYQFIQETSDQASLNYIVNIVGLSFAYQF
jgi:predicted porin